MRNPFGVAGFISITATIVTVGAAYSQNFPVKPLRIVTSAVGGGNDFLARLLAQGLSAPLGQPVVVDNRAGGVIPGEVVSKSPPDGYTLLVAGGAFSTSPLLQETPYDVERDFAPVVLIGTSPNVLVVHPSLPVKSVKELVSLAKGRPGEINYGSANTGGSAHLAAELFKSMAGINIVRVAYKGNGPALTALLGGEVQLMFPNTPSVAPHIKSGKMRALAVTGSQPSALAPGLPTVTASGVSGYEAISIDAVYAPAKTPVAVISRLNQEMVRLLTRPDVKEKLLNVGLEVVASTPEQLAAAIRSEIALWGKVIKESGISVK